MLKNLWKKFQTWLAMTFFRATTKTMAPFMGMTVIADTRNYQFKMLVKQAPWMLIGKGLYSPIATVTLTGEQTILLPGNWKDFLTYDQLQGILAHEYGHFVSRHQIAPDAPTWRAIQAEFQADAVAFQMGYGRQLMEALLILADILDTRPLDFVAHDQAALARARARRLRVQLNLPH